MATVRTEPLRVEHRELVPKLDALRVLAAELDSGSPAVTRSKLDEIVSTMRRDLLPHARAEEAVLYPAVEHAMDAPGAMATMIADHREIARRIDALAGSATVLADRTPRHEQIEDLRGWRSWASGRSSYCISRRKKTSCCRSSTSISMPRRHEPSSTL